MDPVLANQMMQMQSPGAGTLSLPPTMASSYQRTREMTLDELLLENRVIFLVGDIHAGSSARVMMQMLYLEDQKRGQAINFYINSGGGVVDDTLAIYDTMRFITSEVHTCCIGRAYSGAAVLLAAGEDGKRAILPNAKVMIHQPYGGASGQVSDIEIEAQHLIDTRELLNKILAEHTGQTIDVIAKDTDRDRFLSAAQAMEYGLVDEVLKRSEKKPKIED